MNAAPRRRILIVDDDRDFAEAVATFLRLQGFEVLHATGGARGLEMARMRPPDLILMDIMMGERTEGLFTVQQLRRDPAFRDTPIFVVSSLFTEAPQLRADPGPAWMGHNEFFPKPVDLDRLLAAVERHLAGAERPRPDGSQPPEGAP